MRLVVDIGPDGMATRFTDADTHELLDVARFEYSQSRVPPGNGRFLPIDRLPIPAYGPLWTRARIDLRDGTVIEPVEVIFEIGRALRADNPELAARLVAGDYSLTIEPRSTPTPPA